MWIVRLALRRPYTFVVMSLAILLLGITAIKTMPIDIFPYIDIPVVSVVWSYNGISPDEMEKRIVTGFERGMTTTVNDIEHIESQSYTGVAVIRVYLQPHARVDLAMAQIAAMSQSAVRMMPPGTFPPSILKYDASSVPVLQLGLESKTISEQQLFDLGQNYIRTPLATVQGASVPLPYGGKMRQIVVDLDPDALYAKQLSAIDVSNSLNLQNLILPAGGVKIGDREYQVRLNSSPEVLSEMNNLPIKTVNGATVYLKDVANVRDGFAVQTNVVRTNGTRGALLTVMRNGQASTLDIVNQVKAVLPKILAGLPPEMKVRQLFDQSMFVRASINGVLKEATMAAILTGLMILLFLGSWRSTLIVCISIPLSILTSIVILNLMGQTINVMTLGGLALAVGILVDDATVTVENMHRNLAMRKPLVQALLDGAMQIAVPALVSTLAICIVFVPVLLLTGAAKYLFTPLAMAVVFAMLASYMLSRTLVPTMAHYLMKQEVDMYRRGEHGEESESGATHHSFIWRIHFAFNRSFERFRASYTGLLDWALDHRGVVLAGFLVFAIGSLGLIYLVGSDFFPTVDSGQIRLHARAAAGTRIEKTEMIFADIESQIRSIIPAKELETILDNIGLPNGGFNLGFGDSPSIGTSDGDILISLAPEHHSTAVYTDQLRKRLHQKFPDIVFFFEAANITNQILNFGLPAPIDVQVTGRDAGPNYKIAQQLAERIAQIPGAADVHIHQVVNGPELRVNVDRVKAGQLGMTQRDVASSMLISLSGSGQVAPNQWLNWGNGVNYQVLVQTPQYKIDSVDALMRTPIAAAGGSVVSNTPSSMAGSSNASDSFTGAAPSQASMAYGNPGALPSQTQLLSNLATIDHGLTTEIVNHYNVQPVFDVYANVDRRDLGGVASQVEKIMQQTRVPKTTTLMLRGEAKTMRDSFYRLGLGLIAAVVLVYLLMAVNFQSWVDPLIILSALPGALSGILWMLFVTQTTFSVPSLMGAIMCIGVATANSILMVTFANDERLDGKGVRAAALSAGYTRLRPVLMTAAAMILGMIPMALGIGEGAEQNAPLGRAVIGGLLLATVTTLFVVPIVYTYLRKRPPVDHDKRIAEEERDGLQDLELQLY